MLLLQRVLRILQRKVLTKYIFFSYVGIIHLIIAPLPLPGFFFCEYSKWQLFYFNQIHGNIHTFLQLLTFLTGVFLAALANILSTKGKKTKKLIKAV